MPKVLKYVVYPIVFIASFLVFLYWVFPYDILKDRVAAAIEGPLGGAVEVSINEIEPYYFTGVSISGLNLSTREGSDLLKVIELNKVRVRASLFSLLFGTPHVSFFVRSGEGEMSGEAKQMEEGVALDIDFDDFNISDVKWLENKLGLKLSGKLVGNVKLDVNRIRPTRSSGKIDLTFENFKINPSQLNISGGKLEIPEVTFSQNKGSELLVNIDKGAASIDKFVFEGGDFQMDIKGKIFLSQLLSNYRMNLNGTFKTAEGLEEVIPFFFLAKRQKQQDGNYPITITGRFAEPSIKIGNLTVPL